MKMKRTNLTSALQDENYDTEIDLDKVGDCIIGGQWYIVKPGDTFSGIANRFHTTVRVLANANGVSNVNLLYAGQKILIAY